MRAATISWRLLPSELPAATSREHGAADQRQQAETRWLGHDAESNFGKAHIASTGPARSDVDFEVLRGHSGWEQVFNRYEVVVEVPAQAGVWVEDVGAGQRGIGCLAKDGRFNQCGPVGDDGIDG